VNLVIVIVVVELVLTLACMIPAWRAGRIPPTAALRDDPRQGAGRLARAAGRLGRRHVVLGLGAEEAVARPLRTTLTTGAVALAVIGAIGAVGFVRIIDAAVADPARTGDPWDVEVETTGALIDDAFLERVRAVDGVATAFTETDRRSTLGDEAFLSFAVGGEPDAAAFEIGDGRRLVRAGEAIAGYGFLQRFNLDVGDTVSFSAAGTPLDVTIVGWYRETEDSGEILIYRFEQLVAAEPDATPSRVRVSAAPGWSADRLAVALRAALGADAEVSPLEVDDAALDPFRAAMGLIAALVAIVAGAQLLAMMVASSRERARQLGVLRTLGATGAQMSAGAAIAGAIIGTVAVVVGVPVGLGLFSVLADAVTSTIGLGPGFASAPPAGIVATIAVLAVAGGAGLGVLGVHQFVRRSTSELVRWE
jgi:putative ABC transport system permease protein